MARQKRKKSSQAVPLQQTIAKEHLRRDALYRLYYKGYRQDDAIFKHIGQSGMPIFHPPGEPSFQDWFGLNNYGTDWVAIYERDGNPEELGC